ncbi:ABC transporter ATP-binding protein [Lichenihabitans sp. PAMC28606]|uniref:ABC transporter ATP-binding protein n=1 Tax=Lichenihabitans sp. PAMC28606 TaxID=2880932 RepID=UPI001D0B6934|nr:ABC transporter ATP-binding protein [Lichenihabitans sp. PAMC28606]UDL96174.1 ABC transporter ATP-binding protein [Lichenihabitans sp. PAMC28606]
MTQPLLEVRDLDVAFTSNGVTTHAVRGVSFDLGRERLGVVGESGSGKSTTGRAILGLVPPPGRVTASRLALSGEDLRGMSARQWSRYRGRRIAMVMQDPKFSLNPVMTVERQVTEAYRLHHRVGAAVARRRALAMLEAVSIDDPESVLRRYPHQLSGGMGQRVMIAAMLIAEPDLLIADEAISALDVTVQNEVMGILDRLVRERGMGLIFISHNLTAVASFCDRVLVMYGGRVVEECRADALQHATHPYTRALMAAAPDLDRPVRNLSVVTRDPAWLT